MTDKVKKIREEVERLHKLLPIMDGDNISLNYADSICTALEMYIDSMQEEPQVYIDKITNRLSDKSLETLRKIYDIMTNLG